ncbi:hypothetical protein B0H34DRAFT_262867 [Crassisporium funariophilum]|nr:hypothetical protein B0H34DRAFT_262867 [Crassisporium funariophilum]
MSPLKLRLSAPIFKRSSSSSPSTVHGESSRTNHGLLSPAPSLRSEQSFASKWGGSFKFGLNGIKESSDALPPLKSIVAGLVYLIKNHEQFISNKDAVVRLKKRVEHLCSDVAKRSAQSLNEKERERQLTLRGSLESVVDWLKNMQKRLHPLYPSQRRSGFNRTDDWRNSTIHS